MQLLAGPSGPTAGFVFRSPPPPGAINNVFAGGDTFFAAIPAPGVVPGDCVLATLAAAVAVPAAGFLPIVGGLVFAPGIVILVIGALAPGALVDAEYEVTILRSINLRNT